jgi:hypothetical protein
MTTFAEVQRFRATERRLIRILRRLLDRADEILHGWEVAIREIPVPVRVEPAGIARGEREAVPGIDPFPMHEFRTRRIRGRKTGSDQPQRAPKKKRHLTAAEFDARLHAMADDFETAFSQ